MDDNMNRDMKCLPFYDEVFSVTTVLSKVAMVSMLNPGYTHKIIQL